MKTSCVLLLSFTCISLLPAAFCDTFPAPAGLWLFDDTEAPGRAAQGNDLELVGEHEGVAGPGGKSAARVGLGSHFRCLHGIPPNGSGAKVNTYTLIMDLRSDLANRFNALLQTDPENLLDNVCELEGNKRSVGITATGYSPVHVIHANTWFRLAIVVDNAADRYDLYLNGERVLQGAGQPLDGRYALDPVFLVLADNDGDDHPVDISLLAVFGRALDLVDLAAFDAAYPRCPGDILSATEVFVSGPATAQTGKRMRLGFKVDPAAVSRRVQYRIDWGDHDISPWSDFQDAGEELRLTHAYATAGEKPLRAQVRDECGGASDWIALSTVTVTGPDAIAVLTPPYQQYVRPDGISLLWELNAMINARLEVFFSEGSPAGKVDMTVQPTGFSSFLYVAEVSGLDPGVRYSYRADDEKGRLALSGSFQTAPATFVPFTFTVWSDSQGYNKGAYPDDLLEPTKSMMAHMARSGAAIALTTGDLAEDGAAYTDTRNFFLDRVARFLGGEVPFFIAWGNHDSYRNAAIRRFTQLPSRERHYRDPGFGSSAFTYADCRFICIDYATMLPDILRWLPEELGSEACRSARHRFVFIHVPPYCELWIDGNQELRDRLVPLLEAHHVDICFSGHTHNYERGWKNGVHYVITGGGSWLDHGEPVVKEWPHMFVGGKNPAGDFPFGLINQYMRIEVTDSGWTGHCVAFRPDGTEIGVIDTFSAADPGAPAP